jgi:hypothetical protein
MNSTKTLRIIAVVALLVSAIAVSNLAASAADDKTKDFTIGKKGVIHFNVPVRAGDTLLQPGMYQLQHTVEGNDHVVIFKSVAMPAGYRHGNTPVSNDVTARIKCKVVAAEKVNRTQITLRTNAAGEKEIVEVQVAGEAFRHLL